MMDATHLKYAADFLKVNSNLVSRSNGELLYETYIDSLNHTNNIYPYIEAFTSILSDALGLPTLMLLFDGYIPSGTFIDYKFTNEGLTLPKNIKELKSSSFALASGITTVNATGVQYVHLHSFMHVKSLKTINLPDVVEIGVAAFQDCSKLDTLHFGADLATIGNGAFAECSSLKEIYLPKGLICIGHGAFKDTPLETIYFDGPYEDFNRIMKRFPGALYKAGKTKNRTIICSDKEVKI